jgi:hypothetical protein
VCFGRGFGSSSDGAFVVVKKHRSFEVLLRFIQGAHRLVTQIHLLQNTIDAFGHGVFQRVRVLGMLTCTCQAANGARYSWLQC